VGESKMKRTILRVYDRNDEYSLKGEKCFVVIDETDEYFDMDTEVDYLISKISSMPWQSYTSYMVATVELEEIEMYWCEIIGGDCKEVCIDIDRVYNVKNYKLPWID